MKDTSDLPAYEALVARFARSRKPIAVEPAETPTPATRAPDVEALRREFDLMQDIHEFFPLLKRHDMTRRGAIDVLDPRYVRALSTGATRALLESAAGSELPIMCFVGSRGCIQIHTGPVKTVKAMGPWLNVLDPGFNLHLREDLIAEAWTVRKPTRHGEITSVELYDGDGGLIAQFFGVRTPGEPENPAWRSLVAGLPAATAQHSVA
jgi:putative hemin transport protein